MSSNEKDFNDSEKPYKKRRIQRACDICRQRKSDGNQMPGNRCSDCISHSFECTYLAVSVKKPGLPRGYVTRLETRIEKLEKALTWLFPSGDILKDLDGLVDIDTWVINSSPRPLTDSEASATSAHIPQEQIYDNEANLVSAAIQNIGKQHTEYPQDDDTARILLADHFKNLHVGTEEQTRFFGKSSERTLINSAIDLKNEYTGRKNQPILGSKREEFWEPRPWERTAPQLQKATFVFPDDDLVESLLDLYFENFNLFLPLLHRPSFEKSVTEGLHFYDDGFGANFLLVCAVASRLSDDPRVLMDGVESCYSSGWKWFHQAQAHQVSRSLLGPPSLYDLQFYCLSVIFLDGSSAPLSCWTMVGIGIRLAQEVGAHRRRYDRNTMTMEDELWKRAFWVLVEMDRTISSGMGRPCAIEEEDFDVDFPIECDDEYWENTDPAKRFKQPSNKPSYIAGFNLKLKLNQVMAIMLRTIYSTNKHRANSGLVEQNWNQRIVAELDCALNKWVASVPDHLRWDPMRENINFFQQSAWLYCTYYYIQIMIHRSFIPSPRKPSPIAFPSLAICTNAARSCSHIVDIYHNRDLLAPPVIQKAIWTAGLVLLLNIWVIKRSGLSIDPSKEMIDVDKCLKALRRCEVRWHHAGQMWDILYELAFLGELPLPSANTPPSNKNDNEFPASSSTHSANSPDLTSPGPPCTIAGSGRVTPDHHAVGKQPTAPKVQPQLEHEPQVPFTLPFSSEELGRFPVSSQLRFAPAPQQTASIFRQGAAELPTTQCGRPGPSTAPLPFNMDWYTQMGFGNSPPLAQSSSAQSLYGRGSLGAGAAPMPLNQPPMELITEQGQYFAGMDPNIQSINDTFAMWSNAPSSFKLYDWETYLMNLSELTHERYHPPTVGKHQ